VQYARGASNVVLKGDAWTWWDKAARAKFARGHEPEVGAVMVFRKTQHLRRGHVAVVAEVVDEREVLIDHANWASRRAERGQVDTGVRVIDVSPSNDWSRVRVWHGPSETFGKRVYPAYGFIYPPTQS
jgi:surface antigen